MKTKRRIFAGFAAAALAASVMAVSASATELPQGNYTPLEVGSSTDNHTTSFDKYLVMKKNANVPTAEFLYDVTAGTPVAAQAATAAQGNPGDDGYVPAKGAKLAKSIKAVDAEYSWTLEMSASTARDGKLSFDGIADLEKQGLKLYVVSDGKMTEITEGKSVDVALAKSASQLEVRVAAPNAVVATKIGGFKSSVAGSTLQLGFDAPESVAGAKSNYVIAGVDGKVVASGHFTATAGSNRLSLKAPKPGIYFVRIKVGRQDMTGKFFVR